MAVHKNLIFPLLSLFILKLATVQGSSPVVEVKNGTLEGSILHSRRGREILSFRGIPYATPPLGELRFEPPTPAAKWNGVRQAKEDAPICTQRNIYTHQEEVVGMEDCLYLNVYTPKLPSARDKSQGEFPVMIWFHGGGWVTGAGHSQFYGPKFLLDHDMILVTVNFRLGPMGFLSTEDMVTPGNMGMKDQAQAIRWVHENIAAFGGDPKRVTLFGESAGGASVNYHMISSLSKGLFHRGISQSGTAHCPWTLTRPGHAKEKVKKVGELLNCPTEDSKALITCLRQKSASDIIATDQAFQIFDYCPMIPFRPVIEPDHQGAFLKEDPAVSSQSGRFVDIPWMTGITSEEGALRVPGLYGLNNGKLVKQLNDEFMRIAPVTLLYEDTCPKHLRDDVTRRIREFYFGDRAIDNSTRFDTIDMYSDAWFNYAAYMSVQDFLNTQSSPLYFYYFNYRGSSSFSKIFGDGSVNYGVSHADDLQYLFPVWEQLFADSPLTKQDDRIVDVMTSLWFNFAKTGNPTPEITETLPVKWKPVRSHAIEYLHISNTRIGMADTLTPKRFQFWETLPVRVDLGVSSKLRHRTSKDEL